MEKPAKLYLIIFTCVFLDPFISHEYCILSGTASIWSTASSIAVLGRTFTVRALVMTTGVAVKWIFFSPEHQIITSSDSSLIIVCSRFANSSGDGVLLCWC